MQLFFDHSADANTQSDTGSTPLHYASHWEKYEYGLTKWTVEGVRVTLLGTWPTFFFLFSTDMYLYDHMTSTHMTAYLYNRAILLGTPLFPPFVRFPLFSSYSSL